ncbi:protein phosphatase 1 regulatory subunit 36 isoform X1 [Amblyraja radiata]|uniref:protein phosphatase 1 regulatory subunit 36 isoform X1 n=1 Tax=Amblyraja radiata TaxID=386614 RepID=UPI0014032A7A|nr:protein phosphatase 1 regulatory subunit 36 isoform X1 [Amblyraja radiata]
MDARLSLEQLFAAIPAQWVWKDDANKLELVSLQPTPDGKDKKALARVRAILDPIHEALEKSKYGVSRRAYVSMAKVVAQPLSNLQDQQKQEEHLCRCVTLNDIKYAALLLLGEKDPVGTRKRFRPMLRKQQLDDFLMALIRYFSILLPNVGSESKAADFVTNVEKVEKDVCQCKIAQKQLAHTYATLLLGLGMMELHHMACGKSLGSATRKDRLLFECLYAYSVHVVWVTYGRKNLEVIRAEVGRLLRSEAFNPAQYMKEKDQGGQKPQSEHRRQQAKRPAISSIVHQRSPVLMTELQTARDKSDYLFRQHGVKLDLGAPQQREKAFGLQAQPNKPPPLGILGEPLSKFLQDTLIPFEVHAEGSAGEGAETDTEEGDGGGQDEELKSVLSLEATARQGSVSTHAVTMSRTTTGGTDSRHSLLR